MLRSLTLLVLILLIGCGESEPHFNHNSSLPYMKPKEWSMWKEAAESLDRPLHAEDFEITAKLVGEVRNLIEKPQYGFGDIAFSTVDTIIEDDSLSFFDMITFKTLLPSSPGAQSQTKFACDVRVTIRNAGTDTIYGTNLFVNAYGPLIDFGQQLSNSVFIYLYMGSSLSIKPSDRDTLVLHPSDSIVITKTFETNNPITALPISISFQESLSDFTRPLNFDRVLLGNEFLSSVETVKISLPKSQIFSYYLSGYELLELEGLRGDFNGDHLPDTAFYVLNTETGQQDVAILESGPSSRFLVISFDEYSFSDLDELSPLKAHTSISPTLVNLQTGDIIGPDLSRQVVLVADGIEAHRDGSCGRIFIYWDGERYALMQAE